MQNKQTNVLLFCKQKVSKTQAPEKEDHHTGIVTWKVYFDYWKAGAGLIMGMLMAIFFIGTQVNRATFS